MSDTKVLRHVVMFGFRETASHAEIDEIIRRLVALKDLVPGIESLEWGENNSPEGKANGLSHCFLLTFASEAARDAYLPHPDHAAFSSFARPWIDRVTVIDYWAETGAP